MQVGGVANVTISAQKWTIGSFSSSTAELRRIIGPQMYSIKTVKVSIPLLNEISTFWLTGGTNFYARGSEVPYQQSSLVPTPSSCTVVSIAPKPNSVYTNVFQVTTVLGVILIFRFSPTQGLPPIVEIDPGSPSPITIDLSVMSITPDQDQNLVSVNGHYSRKIERFNYSLPAAMVNAYVPIPLRRIIGVQIWNVELFDGTRSVEGGKFVMTYGNKSNAGGYIGMISPNAVARIPFTDGLTVTPLPVTSTSLEFPRTFRVTLTPSGTSYDFWFDPETYAPTVMLAGPPLTAGTSLLVKIQRIIFNAG